MKTRGGLLEQVTSAVSFNTLIGALYPLELIKTRMQVIDTKDHVYRHFIQSFRTVVRNEGFRGLYQGMSPALFAASGSWGGYFYFYEKSKTRKLEALEAAAASDVPPLLSSADHVSVNDQTVPVAS
jgi:hypothetical protein